MRLCEPLRWFIESADFERVNRGEEQPVDSRERVQVRGSRQNQIDPITTMCVAQKRFACCSRIDNPNVVPASNKP
jgi:hypothetical protein